MTINYLLGDESSSDTITTEGGDPLFLYSSPSTDTLQYSINVDWNGDGEYDGDNEADYLIKWSSSRGRERVFSPSGRGFQPYEIGRLTATLDNSNRRYDPWNTSSPLYGDLMPGRNIEMKVAYPSTSATGVTSQYIFTGTITDIQVNGYNNTVNIICEDGWRFLADWDFMKFPYTSLSFGVEGELALVLRSEHQFDSDDYSYDLIRHNKYPWGLAYDLGSSSTDLPRHWWFDGSAKQAVEMITFGSLGTSYIQKDGQFMFKDLTVLGDDAPDVNLITEESALKNIYLPAPWDNMYSNIKLRGSNNFWYDNVNVAMLRSSIKIDAGDTVDFILRTGSTDSEIDADYCTRIKAITATVNTGLSTTDTAISSSDITYTVDPYIKTFHVQVTNGSASNGYINEFEITGELLDVLDAEWEYETTSAYRESAFILDNPWLSITAVGSTDDYFEETSTTIDDRIRINTVGETLKSYFSSVQPFPVIQYEGRWSEQFGYELEDLITVSLSTLNIDEPLRISKIKHESIGSPQRVLTTFWFYPDFDVVSTTDSSWNSGD